MSDQPFAILVVCVGNVCRSPLAERLLQRDFEDMLRSDERPEVSSAGLLALVGQPIDEQAARELVRLGGDPAGFTARQLTPALIGEADLVLTATKQLRSRILEDAPRALKRTFTIRELSSIVTADAFGETPSNGPLDMVGRAAALRGSAAPAAYDVGDPFGRSAIVHREVADVLASACHAIATAVTQSMFVTP
jgi:protein-tyrosine phosphatase